MKSCVEHHGTQNDKHDRESRLEGLGVILTECVQKAMSDKAQSANRNKQENDKADISH